MPHDRHPLTISAACLAVVVISACSSGGSTASGRPARTTLPVDLSWSRVWGGGLADSARDIAVSADALYVVGTFVGSVDLDPGAAVAEHDTASNGTLLGSGRTFLSRFAHTGELVWTRTMPGPRVHHRPQVTLGADDTVYIAAAFDGSDDFDPGPNEELHEAPMGGGYYVSAFDSDGDYRFTRSWAAAYPQSSGAEILARSAGDALYVAGPILAEASTGTSAWMLVRLDTNGEEVWGVELDGSYVGGLAVSPERVAVALTSPGTVALFAADGSPQELAWQGGGVPLAAAFGSQGTLYVSGFVRQLFDSTTDLDPTAAEDLRPLSGNDDAFTLALDANGNYLWGHLFGGPGADTAAALALQPDGSLLVAGTFYKNVDFALGTGSDEREAWGRDAFVLALGEDGAPRGAYTFGGDGNDEAPVLGPLGDGSWLITGTLVESVNLSLACSTDALQSAGHGDAYLALLAPGAGEAADDECGTAPPTGPARNQTDPRLADTDLPKNYDECVARGGSVLSLDTGDGRCTFVVSDAEAELFAQCESVGGGIAIADFSDGSSSQTCDLLYPEYGAPCFGNACD